MKRSHGRGPEHRRVKGPGVYLLCRETGRRVGSILKEPAGETWWSRPTVGRYHVALYDCEGITGGVRTRKHGHRMPTKAEIDHRWAESEALDRNVPLRVDPTG